MVNGEHDPSRDGDGGSPRLQSMKQEGAAIALVGAVPDQILNRAVAQFLGRPAEDLNRERVFFLVDRSVQNVWKRLHHRRIPPSDATIINGHGDERRSEASAVQGSSSEPIAGPPDRVHDPDIHPSTIVRKVTDAVESLHRERHTDGFDPAELRVCIDSLHPVAVEHGTEGAQAVVDGVSEVVVEEHDGMAQFVLAHPPDHQFVEALSGFDIVCRLDVQGTTPVQQWYFPDEGITDAWRELSL